MLDVDFRYDPDFPKLSRFDVFIDGKYIGPSIQCNKEDFDNINARLDLLLNAIYQKGKEDGIKEIQLNLRNLCGL